MSADFREFKAKLIEIINDVWIILGWSVFIEKSIWSRGLNFQITNNINVGEYVYKQQYTDQEIEEGEEDAAAEEKQNE